ncbi:SDR family NAD(P)-dependent oxidoreductase [Microvirga antarctica]|uniref:SDR family NAD(P)-dependent oxidoreductase n=1 Tax=Microvirga antarctica TaxID=2819233 RepID=UPI001FE37B13|nr:SDR family NAD(P)-dependent oxidoreductase [Microvirga antarctica]
MSFVNDFSNRTVLVTGAGHGLGRGIAHAFADSGADVWCCDLNEEGLQETARLATRPIKVRTVDVRDRNAVQAYADEALSSTGRIDVLVNDAGGLAGQSGKAVEDVSADDWQIIFDINSTGAFYCTQAVVPAMKKAGYGRIVNISSGAGLALTVTGIQAYAATKAAMIGLTRQLGHELGEFGITVNCVAPGSIPCNPYSEAKWESLGAEGQRAALEKIAMRRTGKPSDIAGAVMFFSSEQTSWVTGQTLLVDGGK